MNATWTEKKVAELNSMCAIVAEWQRGSTNWHHMRAELGRHLTQEQIESLCASLFRTMTESQVAEAICRAIGL